MKAADPRFFALLGVGAGVRRKASRSLTAGKRLAVLLNSKRWRLNIAGYLSRRGAN